MFRSSSKPDRLAPLLGAAVALAVGGVALIAACVGDDPLASTSGGVNQDSGGPNGNVDGSSGSSGGDGGSSGVPCTAPVCADPTTLKRCDGTSETCAFGCDATGGVHCRQVYPSGLVLPTDITRAGLMAITIATSTKLTADTGAIDNVRGANVDPLQSEVIEGIAFRLATDAQGNKLGIWSFDSLSIPQGVTIHFTSTNAVALVASKTITIAGIVDVRGHAANGIACADTSGGPGGFAGGAGSAGFATIGLGPGGGLLANPVGGTAPGAPGGGGHAGLGGKGGPGTNVSTQLGGDGGTFYQLPTLLPLIGGSGGAGGSQAAAGGGGGAIHLVGVEAITVGGGNVNGGVNAGGCGGMGAGFAGSGGGGGAGGSILVETRTLTFAPNGHIAAAGGGGGASDPSSHGLPGELDKSGNGGQLPGGGLGFGGGGSNGFSDVVNGGGGSSSPSATRAGGAGGGAAGRIRINNRTGTLGTLPPTALIPPVGVTNPATTLGVLDVH